MTSLRSKYRVLHTVLHFGLWASSLLRSLAGRKVSIANFFGEVSRLVHRECSRYSSGEFYDLGDARNVWQINLVISIWLRLVAQTVGNRRRSSSTGDSSKSIEIQIRVLIRKVHNEILESGLNRADWEARLRRSFWRSKPFENLKTLLFSHLTV